MGQLVSSADLQAFLDSNLAANIAQATGPYARLFGQAPTFVTYYSQDLAQGSTDVNLGGSIEIVGPESSLRYNSVLTFPLYGIQAADLQTSYDDVQGNVTGNVGGEVYLLPGTLQPFENDFFTIDFLESKLLFRVAQASADRIEGKAFFKLQYFLDQGSPVDLAAQTTGSYQFEIASVGTNVSPLVEASLSLLLQQLSAIAAAFKRAYWKAFYDQSSGSLILRGNTIATMVHDTSLDLFVRRNDVLSSDGYLQNRTVQPPDLGDYGQFEQTVYPTTIYWLSENGLPWPGSAACSTLVDLVVVKPLTPASQFFEIAAVCGMMEAVPVPAPDGNPNYTIGGPGFNTGVDAIAAALEAGTGTEGLGQPLPMQLLAQNCLAGAYRVPAGGDQAAAAAALAAALNDTALMASRPDFFWLGPIALREAALLAAQATVTTN
jgi:hypothetical protein